MIKYCTFFRAFYLFPVNGVIPKNFETMFGFTIISLYILQLNLYTRLEWGILLILSQKVNSMESRFLE